MENINRRNFLEKSGKGFVSAAFLGHVLNLDLLQFGRTRMGKNLPRPVPV
jgi:hypothetical protein